MKSTMVLTSYWLLGTYGVVACIYEWLCRFLSFWSGFVDFHCCHYRLTSFYLITSFFVSYLIMGIPYMMLYSINSDVAVVQRPYPTMGIPSSNAELILTGCCLSWNPFIVLLCYAPTFSLFLFSNYSFLFCFVLFYYSFTNCFILILSYLSNHFLLFCLQFHVPFLRSTTFSISLFTLGCGFFLSFVVNILLADTDSLHFYF